MRFSVNITTFCGLADMFCPYACRGCGRIGKVFCDCCKNNIIFNYTNYCLYCKRQIVHSICDHCPCYSPTFMIGWRDDIIGHLVHDYKYNSNRALSKSLAQILDACLPYFADDVVIVPLPTISKHIRERGFDHTFVLAKKFARIRRFKVQKLLIRNKNHVQVGSNELTRRLQAAEAYCLVGRIDREKTYMLLDDVWTTGSSMTEATKMLQRAGALKVVSVVLAVNRVSKN